jgi:hypothetical protein
MPDRSVLLSDDDGLLVSTLSGQRTDLSRRTLAGFALTCEEEIQRSDTCKPE